MKISHDGDRPRFYVERKKLAAQVGDPLREGVSDSTRKRIVREFMSRGYILIGGRQVDLSERAIADINRIEVRLERARNSPLGKHTIENLVTYATTDEFLQILEIWANRVACDHPKAVETLEIVQSLLADDLSAFRLVNVGAASAPRVQAQLIDNAHLHAVLTDRVFELTRITEFTSAQCDYADAWKHYSSGNLDNALTDAHKAVESACKNVIKKLDPLSSPNDMQLGAMVAKLVTLKVFPDKLPHMCGQLDQIFRSSGTLRNQPGAAHGSLDPITPAASVALLGLRMSGTLIAFLAERWTQMQMGE